MPNSAEIAAAHSTARTWYGGLDVVRIAAVFAVAVEHLLAVYDYATPDLLLGLGLGQTGVTTFCSISGFLAFSGTSERPMVWLERRLQRIYVPFWMAVAGVFAANAIVPYKPVTPLLFVSEMSGLGYFFYPTQLLGVHFWFISLILACYVLAFLIRVSPKLTPLVMAIVLISLYTTPQRLGGNLLTFLFAMWIAQSGVERRLCVAVIIGSTLLALRHYAGWANVAVGTSALLLGLLAFPRPVGFIHTLSLLSYEFYLVHGPIYLGLRKVTKIGFFANALVGTSLAFLAAWLLAYATKWVFRLPAYWRMRQQRL